MSIAHTTYVANIFTDRSNNICKMRNGLNLANVSKGLKNFKKSLIDGVNSRIVFGVTLVNRNVSTISSFCTFTITSQEILCVSNHMYLTFFQQLVHANGLEWIEPRITCLLWWRTSSERWIAITERGRTRQYLHRERIAGIQKKMFTQSFPFSLRSPHHKVLCE